MSYYTYTYIIYTTYIIYVLYVTYLVLIDIISGFIRLTVYVNK